MAILNIENLTKRFGGLKAVDGVSFKVEKGEIFGLIGPNGAGKSTTLNMIDGSLSSSGGKIVYNGQDITRKAPYKRAAAGIARVFQRDVLFSSFSILENVMIGCHLQTKNGIRDAFFPWSRSAGRKERELRKRAMDLLKLVGLEELYNSRAVNLPHGNQRVLGLLIAMATEADLMLLDEPLTGMNAREIAEMMELIKRMRDEMGKTVLIVEHNMKAVIGLCDRTAVLDYGKKISEGSPKEVIENPVVIEAYLGVESDVADY